MVVTTAPRHTGQGSPAATPKAVTHAAQTTCPHGTSAVSRRRSRQSGHSSVAALADGFGGVSGAGSGAAGGAELAQAC